MKKSEINIGGIYVAKVTGKLARIRIDRENARGGWDATNLETKRRVRIKSARRLRHEVDPHHDAVTDPKDDGHHDESGRDGEPHDADDRCSTSHCPGRPVLEYLGRPLCQECWQRQAEDTTAPESSAPAIQTMSLDHEEAIGEADSDAEQNAPDNAKGRRLSALDAAATVLTTAQAPMRCRELIEAMAAQGLWTSPNGKMPHATLNSALIREIRRRGNQSRFRRCGRGMFRLNAECKTSGVSSN